MKEQTLDLLARALTLARLIHQQGRGVYVFYHGERQKVWVGREGRSTRFGSEALDQTPGDVFDSLRALQAGPAFFLLGPQRLPAAPDARAYRAWVVQPDLEFELDADGTKLSFGSLDGVPSVVAPDVSSEGLPRCGSLQDWEGEADTEFQSRLQTAIERVRGKRGKIIVTRGFSRTYPPGKLALDLAERLLTAEPASASVHLCLLPGELQSMGTSPENVFEIESGRLRVDAVAGSTPAGLDAAPEGEQELLDSEKEGREHHMSVERAMAFAERHCVPGSAGLAFTRRVRTLRCIRHLHSRIEGTLEAGTESIEVLALSHPPLASYPEALRGPEEPDWAFPRFYGGQVGRWTSPSECSSFLNLRCIEMEDGRIHTRSGVGVVDGAEVSRECAEADRKLGTVLDAVEAWIRDDL